MSNSRTSVPRLEGFLSDHESDEKVVDISVEPNPVYVEVGRNSLNLNFDFILTGLTERRLQIRFIKVAVYDVEGVLVTFRHLNHNGVGTPGIHTIGRYELNGMDVLDLFNPFFSFPLETPLETLRYMFTFRDMDTGDEFYCGRTQVVPTRYQQETRLSLPLKGLMTIMDGHDFYSHHRRFAMSIVRDATRGQFESNFSRYAVDFTLIGSDGNTRRMEPSEHRENYDFHFKDARDFYTDTAEVYAPADGEVVDLEGDLEDLYTEDFNLDDAVQKSRTGDIAGNYVVIEHTDGEYSHLYHLQRGSLLVSVGDKVKKNQPIARVGFSGAATTYSHLHYQLMDGIDFLRANPLPCKFSDIRLVQGSTIMEFEELALDTGDIVIG